MPIRHRIPSIFNLSMVDVLCCALGCVILLWLLNLRGAKQRADAAGEAEKLLAATRADLANAKAAQAFCRRSADSLEVSCTTRLRKPFSTSGIWLGKSRARVETSVEDFFSRPTEFKAVSISVNKTGTRLVWRALAKSPSATIRSASDASARVSRA